MTILPKNIFNYLSKYLALLMLVLNISCLSDNKNSPSETFGVKDSANVNINLLSINPTTKNLFYNETFQFNASGGTSPYTFRLTSGIGSISQNGFYVAPGVAGSSVISVTDADGKVASASITITDFLVISPKSKTIGKTETLSFSASGGLPPYTFTIIEGSGSMNTSTGLYTAPNADTNVIVKLTDSLDNDSYASVTVTDDVVITPTSLTLGYGEVYDFIATGGQTPYTWSVTGSGSLSASGKYTAPNSDTVDTVRVTDNNTNFSDATVTVVDKPYFDIDSRDLSVGEVYTPNVTGGTGGLTYSIVSGGGSIVAGTGVYTAPSTNQTVVIRVTDGASYTDDLTLNIFKPMMAHPNLYNNCVLNFVSSGNNQAKCFGLESYSFYGKGYTGDEAGEMGDNLAPLDLGSSTPIHVSSYRYGTCIVMSDYNVKCFGSNSYGATGNPLGSSALSYNTMGDNLKTVLLGTGLTINSSLPIEDAIDNAEYFTCVILNDDTVKCWGRNNFGTLGLGDTTNRGNGANQMGDNLPSVSLGIGAEVPEKIAVNGNHACILTDAGNVKCWGRNNYGQLGYEDTQNRGDDPSRTPDTYGFVNLGTGRTAKDITLGTNFTCAILDTDQMKCWGYGYYGELGHETNTNLGDEVGEMGDNLDPIDLGFGRTAKAFDAGASSVCVILDNDDLKCFGLNNYGQLGKGDTAHSNSAGSMGDALLPIELGTGRYATKIFGYESYYCAILDNGDSKCWGRNDLGQLGYEHSIDVGKSAFSLGDNLPAVDLGSGRTATTFATSYAHTCALLDNNTVKCWGENTYGNRGTEDSLYGDEVGEVASLSNIDLGSGINPISLKGYYLTNCALFDNGKLKCFNYNGNGSLGLGHGFFQGSKTSTLGDNLPFIDFGVGVTVTDYDVGYIHNCVITSDNEVKCWGYNAQGQLGQEDTTQRGHNVSTLPKNIPAVDLGTGVLPKKLFLGMYTTCMISTTDQLKCWGYNNVGQLGQETADYLGDGPGEMGDALNFINLGTGRTVKDGCAGDQHTCAILDNDQVKCWGNYTYAGIGYSAPVAHYGDAPGEMGDALAYVNLGTSRTAKKLECGRYHTCAILDNNDLKCWGANSSGELGQGHTTTLYQNEYMGDNLLPVSLGDDRYAVAVYPGVGATCVVLDNKELKCFGINNYAQLGLGHTYNIGTTSATMGNNLDAVNLGFD